MKKILKWVGIAVAAILVVYLIDTKGGKTKGGVLFAAAKEKQWYEGGTLQNATVTEWKTAQSADQIATCAAWLTQFSADSAANAKSMDEWKTKTVLLKNGIDAYVINMKRNDTLKVAQIAKLSYIVLTNYAK